MNADTPLAEPLGRRIAHAFLPNRYHYYYARSKLGSDPLYGGVSRALADTTAPLLDLGCGIGLLMHALPRFGRELRYLGVDNDAAKIASARDAAARTGCTLAAFDVVDLAHGFPPHRGSVAILDMLQFLTPEERSTLLRRAVDCLTPDARVVIRTGLADGNWRRHVTRAGDMFARFARWMNAAPKTYPTRMGLQGELSSLGLDIVDCAPLWGRTPFNNWLVVAALPSSPGSDPGSTVE